MLLINHPTQEPAFNLALEEYLLTSFNQDILCLWRNAPAIIVGRFQNTLEEINSEYVAANRLPVIRRLTGGGAVYHDLGNINYTLIYNQSRDDINNYAKFTAPVIAFLATLGVEATLSGRNDLLIEGMKFCGNAQTLYRHRLLHHGCIMFDTDLSRLSQALRPSPVKIESKGVKSVRSRVTAIAPHLPRPMCAEEFLSGLSDYFLHSLPGAEPYTLNGADLKAVRALTEQKYATWDWNYGRSPVYSWQKAAKFPFGLVDIRMNVEQGRISEMAVYGDFFSHGENARLTQAFIGLRHERDALLKAAENLPLNDYIIGIDAETLVGLMV